MNPDPAAEHAHPSAVGALQVFDDFMKRRVPDIDDPLPPPGEMVTWSCEQAALYGGECDQTTGEIIVQPTMPPEARDYVDIVEWFAMLYPEDELIPAASWRAAGLYLRTFEIAEAAHRFETIIEHHPRHRFAQQAALGAFVCYNHVEDWIKIERVARMLLDVCDEVEDDEICSPERLAQAIAYAMNNQAEDLMDAGDGLRESGDLRGARGQYVLAAERRVALYREFPDSEWSPLALYNAAATYETARDIDESVSLYNEFITRYDEHEFIPDAKFTLGLIHDSQANFLLAVDWFEQVMEYDDFVDRSAAVLNAARLREALSQFDDAIEHYEEYMSLEPTAPIINDLYFVLADIEHDDLNDLDAAYSRYSSFLDDVSDDHVRRLIAVHRQAKIREEQDRDRDALSLHEQVYNLYGPGEMGFGEDDLPTDWITAPGANFADEAERIAVLPYAAEARFNLAEASYEAARAADLTYREGEWEELTEKLSARGEAIVAAQHEMWTVYRMGDAAWAVAATARIGQTYYDFYRDIFALEAPDYDRCLDLTNWDYDACDEFMEMYDETLFNIGEPLRAKAEGAWGQGRDAAIQNNIFNEWTTQITALLNDLDRTYALGMTEGFDADHTSDAYLSTNYTLDLAEKLDAFADFVEPMLLDGPGLQLDGGEGVAPEPEMPEHSAPVDEPGQEPEAAPVDDAATEGGEG